ncbi:hypothetical protein [Sphingomonas sp. ID0503]|uniref:hypothetical protein n=1 Tax=Sphingomonas sp. ID0503 TaxID=3399691 RepID=UPI003AFA8252
MAFGGLIALAAAAANTPAALPVHQVSARPLVARLSTAIGACMARMVTPAGFAVSAADGLHSGGAVPMLANVPAPPDWGQASDYRVDGGDGVVWVTSYADRDVCRVFAGDNPGVPAARGLLAASLLQSGAWTSESPLKLAQGTGQVALDRFRSVAVPGVKMMFSGPARSMNDGSGLQLLVVVSKSEKANH